MDEYLGKQTSDLWTSCYAYSEQSVSERRSRITAPYYYSWMMMSVCTYPVPLHNIALKVSDMI
jgi:hypothetical protein